MRAHQVIECGLYLVPGKTCSWRAADREGTPNRLQCVGIRGLYQFCSTRHPQAQCSRAWPAWQWADRFLELPVARRTLPSRQRYQASQSISAHVCPRRTEPGLANRIPICRTHHTARSKQKWPPSLDACGSPAPRRSRDWRTSRPPRAAGELRRCEPSPPPPCVGSPVRSRDAPRDLPPLSWSHAYTAMGLTSSPLAR